MNANTKSFNEEIESGNFQSILSYIPQSPLINLTKQALARINSALVDPKTPITHIYCVSLIYIIYFSQHLENFKPTGELASHLYLLLERLPGCITNQQILTYLTEFLHVNLNDSTDSDQDMLETLGGLQDQILGVSKEFLFPKELNEEYDWKIEHIISMGKKEKSAALLEYLNFLCDSISLQEQLLVLSKFSKEFFENLLKPKKNHDFFEENSALNVHMKEEIFHSLHKFLDSAVYQHRYSIIFQKGKKFDDFNIFSITKQSEDQLKYEDFSKINAANDVKINGFIDIEVLSLLKTFPIYESIEPIIDFLLRNIVLTKESVSQELKLELIKFLISLIFERLWDVYPQHHEALKLRLQSIFKELDRENLHICQIQAAFLMYEKSKTKSLNGYLKQLLSENPQIKSSVESFQKDGQKYYKGPGYLNELMLKDHCPLNQTIDAGSAFIRLKEVYTPNSLIYWVFATRNLDIDFQVEYLGPFDLKPEENNEKFPLILVANQRLDTGKKVHRGVIFAKKPGLYKFTWDNSYSWFTEKFLRYRLCVLEPEGKEEEGEKGEDFNNVSPHIIFNSSRDLLGLERTKSRKDSYDSNNSGTIPVKKQKSKQKLKETLDSIHKWKGNFRVLIHLKANSITIKAINHQKSFELEKEFDEYTGNLLQDSLLEVLNKVSHSQSKEIVDILLLSSLKDPKVEIVGFSNTKIDFVKAFMHTLLRKFAERVGEIQSISRKPLAFSQILIISLVENKLFMVVFSDLSRNLVDFDSEIKEKKEELLIKSMINSLILLKFSIGKVIINKKGIFEEGINKENLKQKTIKMMREVYEMDDAEEVLISCEIDFEFCNFDFSLDMLLN